MNTYTASLLSALHCAQPMTVTPFAYRIGICSLRPIRAHLLSQVLHILHCQKTVISTCLLCKYSYLNHSHTSCQLP